MGTCKGKRATFGDLTNFGVITPEKPTAPTHSASTKPSEKVNYDSDSSDVDQAMGQLTSTNVADVETFGYTLYPVQMSTEEPSTGITVSNIAKMRNLEALDHFCIICNMGGNWDIDVLFDHHMDYHDLEVVPLVPTMEQFLEAEERHFSNPYIPPDSSDESDSGRIILWTSDESSNENSSSGDKQKKKDLKKSQSDYSSDNSTSGQRLEKRRVMKSAAQRNAAISDEKIKHVEDKLTNDIKQIKIDTDYKISAKIEESKQTLSKINSINGKLEETKAKIEIIAKESKHSEDGL